MLLLSCPAGIAIIINYCWTFRAAKKIHGQRTGFYTEGDEMTKTRWALLLMALAAGGVTLSALAADERPRKGADDSGTWQSQEMELGKTGYVVFVGPWGTNDPLKYTVAVGRKKSDGGLSTTFAANFHVAGLPKGFSKRLIGEVVRFDAAAQQQVTFDLGGQEVRYQLPER